MRHLLATSLWFAAGWLCRAVIAATMPRRAEATPIDPAMALQTRAVQTATLDRDPGAVHEALRPKAR